MSERIITLVDMDCFYCQVEARLNPSLVGKPMAVVQYNAWKGGGIIAVNYEAREYGVTRHIRGNEAKEKCPEIALVQVPELRGKADLTKYRDAGREVVNVLSQFSNCVERASVDEAYIDLTRAVEERLEKMEKSVTLDLLPNTFIVGFSEQGNNNDEQRENGLRVWLSHQMQDENHTKLAVAGVIVEEMRAAVYKQTGFRCSAGIGHNKVLAKLVCGLHKPNRQTILPHAGVNELYRNMPVKNVRHLGGKLGESVVEVLGCKVMSDLAQFSEAELQAKFDFKIGSWLYNIARGFDHDPVTPRLLAKSIGCSKQLAGTQALTSQQAVEKWALDLAKELEERLTKDKEENKRFAKLLTVSFTLGDTASTRSSQIVAYSAERIAADAMELIRKSNADKWSIPIQYLGLSAGKFVDECSPQNSIQNFFKCIAKPSCGEVGNVAQANDDSAVPRDRSKYQDKDYNHSFFIKYFKKQSKESTEYNSKYNEPCTSKVNNESNAPINEKGNYFSRQAGTILREEKPGCSKVNISEIISNSNSSDSVTFISLGEIFPDLNTVDDNVAELLPSPMQRELKARKANTFSTKPSESNIGSQVSSKSELFPAFVHSNSTNVIDECKAVTENRRLSDYDPFHLDESTDVDDDLLPVEKEKSIFQNNEATNSKVSDSSVHNTYHQDIDNDSHVSLTEEVYNELHLCPQCSKHIPLQEFEEHLDFHAAQKLHKELNSGPAPIVKRDNTDNSSACSKKSPAKVYNGKKRGRPCKNAVPKGCDKKLRSITAFFTPNK